MLEEEKAVIEYDKCSQDLKNAGTYYEKAQRQLDEARDAERIAKRNLRKVVTSRALVYKGNIYFCEPAQDEVKILPLINHVE